VSELLTLCHWYGWDQWTIHAPVRYRCGAFASLVEVDFQCILANVGCKTFDDRTMDTANLVFDVKILQNFDTLKSYYKVQVTIQ